MTRKQWEWHPRGWFVLLTFGGAFGLGFMWHAIRYNGIDIYFGPLCLTIQPPAPKWLYMTQEQIDADKTLIGR